MIVPYFTETCTEVQKEKMTQIFLHRSLSLDVALVTVFYPNSCPNNSEYQTFLWFKYI